MIETKADLHHYIAQDMQCNGIALGGVNLGSWEIGLLE